MSGICIASAGLGHVNRGIEVWAKSTAAALSRRGCDVKLCRGAAPIVASYESHVPCFQRGAGTARWLAKVAPKRFFWRLGFGSPYAIEQTSFALRLFGYLKSNGFSILHVQDPPVARLMQWANRRGLIRTRTILGHGTDESLAFIRHFDFLQHLSPYHLEEAKGRACWKPSWTAIPNFVDTQRFAPRSRPEVRERLGIPTNATVIMTAAAITQDVKRVDRLLSEFKILKDQLEPTADVRLLVVGGKAHDTAKLIQYGKSQLRGSVTFLVDVASEEMPSLYNSADVFVLASDREMMPIALLEATASGLPCIVNKHSVLQWMIGPGGTSIDMAVEGRLAQEMKRFADSGQARAELGRQSRMHCLNHFSEDRVVEQILTYYKFVTSFQGDKTGICQVSDVQRPPQL